MPVSSTAKRLSRTSQRHRVCPTVPTIVDDGSRYSQGALASSQVGKRELSTT